MGWVKCMAVLALGAGMAWAAAAAGGEVLFKEDFQRGLSANWKPVKFEGETRHTIVKDGTNSFLQAFANSSASGLGVELPALNAENLRFSWKWKIDKVPPGGTETEKKTFDHTARLYVAFKTFIGPPRTINYVWANSFPVGKTFQHPSSGRARFIVLQSGNDKAGQWLTENRDIMKDWKLLFGDDEPSALVSIGFMTDSDGTKSSVTGFYDDLILSRGQ